MHRDKYWASKIPLPLALLFLLNVFLIAAVELLFIYKYPAQPDAAALARYDEVYEGSRVSIGDSIAGLTASTVEIADGQIHLVVTKGHSVVFGRGKIIYAEPVEMPESGEVTVYVKNGIHTSQIELKDIPTGVWSVTIHYGYSGGIRETTVFYMVLGAVLEGLELLVLYFIQKNLQ